MADTYLSLLQTLILTSPRTGVSMFWRAVEEQRVTREEAVSLVDVIGKQALSPQEKSTTLAEKFFWDIPPPRWRTLLGGDGLEGLTIDGMSAPRALMEQAAKEPLGRPTRTQLNWFARLELPVTPAPNESEAQLAQKALAMRFPTCAAFPRDKNVWKQKTADGAPVALRIETQDEWRAFLEAGHDPWMDVPTKAGLTPLILALIERQSNTGLLLRELRETAMTTIAQNGHPQGRKWAAAYVKRHLKNASKMTMEYWAMALKAVGPELAVSRQLWEGPAQKLLDSSWFDWLAKQPHWLKAIGADALKQAQLSFFIRNMETNYSTNITAETSIMAARGLAQWLSQHQAPEGKAWVLEAAFPPIERKHLRPLQPAFFNAGGAWWGPDPEATERQLFLSVADQLKGGKEQWKVRLQAFDVVANRPEPGPWLQLARAMAESLRASNAKQAINTGLLFEEGGRLIGNDAEAKAALAAMGKALSVEARKSLHAVMKGWALDEGWTTNPTGPKRSSRL